MSRLGVVNQIRTAALIGTATLLCAGCAAMERAEVRDRTQMLTASGFQMRPAATPEQQAQLAALPPLKLLAERLPGKTGTGYRYVYADPEGCKCVYVGDASAYQAYQQLAVERQLADEREAAAEMTDDAAYNWGPWGAGFW
jgi:hypothetical protein